MMVNANSMVSMAEANRNFSEVARIVEENGMAVIMKNNMPRYLVVDFLKADEEVSLPDEDVLGLSQRMIVQNREAYEVLAK